MRLRALVAVAAVAMSAGADVAAGADWRPAFDLAQGYESANVADVAVGPDGDAVVVFEAIEPSGSQTVYAAWSLGGGTFSAPVRISRDEQLAGSPRVAVDDEGDATAVWGEGVLSQEIYTATRPAGGGFGTPEPLSGFGGGQPTVAVDHAGGAIAVWNQASTIQASYRPPGGSWSDPDNLSVGETKDPDVAMDPAGNAVAIWTQDDGSFDRVTTAERAPGDAFGAGSYRSAPGAPAGDGDVAMNAGGDAVAVWLRESGGAGVIQAETKPAGETFGGEVDLSSPPKYAGGPQVGLDDAGNVTVAWHQNDDENRRRINYATRPAGGEFSERLFASKPDSNSFGPAVATGAAGRAIIAWTTQVGATGEATFARTRQAAADPFSGIEPLSTEEVDAVPPPAGMDAAGDALVPWTADVGDDFRAQAAIFDASPPTVGAVLVPAGGVVGVPVEVSAVTSDRWSPHTTAWAFGDGGAAEGDAASHVYGAPGTYAVNVTATDAAGNATTETRSITINPAPSGPIAGPPPPPVAVIASVSGLRIAPRAFPAAARGASVAQRRRGTGARVSYRLNVAADVRFTVRRRARGRRVGRRCVRPTRRNRGRRRCARFVRVRGSFSRASTAGDNRFRFTGRLRSRKLRPGRYRLVATPRAGTVAGPVRRTAFRIVSRR